VGEIYELRGKRRPGEGAGKPEGDATVGKTKHWAPPTLKKKKWAFRRKAISVSKKGNRGVPRIEKKTRGGELKVWKWTRVSEGSESWPQRPDKEKKRGQHAA